MADVIAVDVGGTKLAAGIVCDDGTLRERFDAPTRLDLDGDALFTALTDLVDRLDASGAVAVGAGCGGPMDADGEHVSPLNIRAWRAFPLRARLAEHTGLPTFVDNDAKALAIGEGWIGAATGARNYLGMVVSTGVGGGIVLDGRLLDGRIGNAGHIGHVIVEPDGHVCGCGARGCLEAEASGTAIARITGRQPIDAPLEVRERTGMLVGRAVASVANLLDLPLAVVSGSVALGFGEPFFAAAQRELDSRCRLDFSRGTRIVPGALGPDGPLIGAARIALRSEPA
ncbi:MAG: glucokinase [Actinomycetota bacterium]|nr:glucokinase [Actinomycetota bacterium]